jgi:hypothetical protein
MYKLIKTNRGDGVSFINADGSVTTFPFDPANTDYQAYLKFLEDGGIPEPADEVK